MLTGLKLNITYLSSVFKSIGTTDAILALLGKVEVLMLLLMVIDSGSANTPDENLTSLVGILSIPDAFLESRDFRMVFDIFRRYLKTQLEEVTEMELDCKLLFLWTSARLRRDFCICLK